MNDYRAIVRSVATALGIAAFLFSAPARAERLSAPLEAAIHIRALGYDRALKKRAGNTAVIALLYDASSDSSVQAADALKDALVSLSKKMKVQDLSIVIKSVAYKDTWPSSELAKVAAVYVSPGLESHLADIKAQSAKAGIPTLCGDRDLARQGIAIAAYVKGNSPGITINLAAARGAGMDLDTRLLAIAEVLK